MNKSKKISFKKKQFLFFIGVLKNKQLIETINDQLKKDINKQDLSKVEINFLESEIEMILDDLSYELTLNGINKKGEINENGNSIEEIIDLFTDS